MKKYILICLLIASRPFVAHCQDVSKTNDTSTAHVPPVITQNSLGMAIFGVYYMHEQKIGKYLTLGGTFFAVSNGYDGIGKFLFDVSGSVDLRWYYNRSKRYLHQRNTSLNAGSFLGTQVKYTYMFLDGTSANYLALPGVYWGLRRALSKSVYFEFDLGAYVPIYLTDDNFLYKSNKVPVFGNIRFGYTL